MVSSKHYNQATTKLAFHLNETSKDEACIGFFWDMKYLPFYFQGYRILSILLPAIWDTVINIFVTFRDMEYLEKLLIGIFANLQGILAYFLQGIWDIWYPPIQASKISCQ